MKKYMKKCKKKLDMNAFKRKKVIKILPLQPLHTRPLNIEFCSLFLDCVFILFILAF